LGLPFFFFVFVVGLLGFLFGVLEEHGGGSGK